MNVPKQTSILYHGVWTSETDTILSDTIIGLKKETRWTESYFPSWFLMTAEQELKTKAGVVVSEDEVSTRIDVFHKRYQIFKDVVGLCGAQWDRPTNTVVAGDDVWDKIMKYNWFAGGLLLQ
ncbi:hypothetical protein AAHA92_20506 [Salvia divinorum]|uniref:Myb/SANT-like domain-containing protein n=1 Tax=Salvia divinorum TaxID=28513 RepID=A0ABD1GHE3_SALDI